MKKLLSATIALALLLVMATAGFAADPENVTIRHDYNGDGVVDYKFAISKVIGTETGTLPAIKPAADTFTSGQLTHPGGEIELYVVEEGAVVNLNGSGFILGHSHEMIYKMEKGADGVFQSASFTRAPYTETGDLVQDMIARNNAGFVEYSTHFAEETEPTVGGIQWYAYGEGSYLKLEQEGYYVLNVMGVSAAALKSPPPERWIDSNLTDQALTECCVFLHVVKGS